MSSIYNVQTKTMTKEEYDAYIKRGSKVEHVTREVLTQPCMFDNLDPLKMYSLVCTCPKCSIR